MKRNTPSLSYTKARRWNSKELTYNKKTYASINELCREYKICPSTLKQRLGKGQTLEQALSRPIKKVLRITPIMIGNDKYDSTVKLCKAYGVSYKTFRKRIAQGMTVEEALHCKSRLGRKPKSVEIDGETYTSISEMCKAYGISYSTYRDRTARGVPITEAVHINQRQPLSLTIGIYGEKYATITEMCNAYGIKRSTYLMRLKKGMSRKLALTTPLKNRQELNAAPEQTENKDHAK